MIISCLLFTLIFLYIPLWVPINLFLSSLGKKRPPISSIENKQLQQLILNKTGVAIKSIKISQSVCPFGMMIGIPSHPQLILSRNLYETFSPKELEYVVLHEAGHYKLGHGIKELIIGLVLFFIGLFIINNFIFLPSMFTAVMLGIVFGVIMIRIGRMHEYQADYFSLKKMTDPTGMISATNKFRGFYGKSYTENRNKLLQFLFYRGNPYANRIKMAEKEIEEKNYRN